MYQWCIPFILPSRQVSHFPTNPPTNLPSFLLFHKPLHLFLTFPLRTFQNLSPLLFTSFLEVTICDFKLLSVEWDMVLSICKKASKHLGLQEIVVSSLPNIN